MPDEPATVTISAELTARLLDIARVEMGGMPLSEIVNRALHLYARQVEARRHEHK